MENNEPLLTEARLVAVSMGGATAEIRESAKRLLEAGLFRQATREEEVWEEHPYNLAGQYPLWTEEQFAEMFPVADWEMSAMDGTKLRDVLQELSITSESPKPADSVITDTPGQDSLEARTSLSYKTAHPEEQAQPVIKPMVKALPFVSTDDFDLNKPLY